LAEASSSGNFALPAGVVDSTTVVVVVVVVVAVWTWCTVVLMRFDLSGDGISNDAADDPVELAIDISRCDVRLRIRVASSLFRLFQNE
jgi:hypothetical protein